MSVHSQCLRTDSKDGCQEASRKEIQQVYKKLRMNPLILQKETHDANQNTSEKHGPSQVTKEIENADSNV